MPAVRVGSCTSSPMAGAGAGLSANLANRVRSASPSRRALAIDMRRIASLLRDPPVGLPGEGSVNTSISSSPHSAWEPGDRGAAPIGANNAAARAAVQSQFSALAEKVNVVIAGLQRQCDSDRRRVAQIERKLETRLEERNRENDGREKWAEVQGSVNGLLEETQTLNRRMEDLEQRLWARTSGTEIAKQRNKELEQQVQSLEKSRLAAAAMEETQKRQATKIRRTEHALEELTRRVAKAEEETRHRSGQGSVGYNVEQRLSVLEQHQEQLGMDIHQLQDQLDEGFQAMNENQMVDEGAAGGDVTHGLVEDAVQTAERGLSLLEKKLTGQIEELASSLASLRVKADGQFHRVSSLTERLETAHEPAIESIRSEVAQARAQDKRELEGELQVLRLRVQEATDGNEEANTEFREALRQAHAEIAAVTLRPEGNPVLRTLEERLVAQEREVMELIKRFDSMPPPGEVEQLDVEDKFQLPEEWEDMRRRMEWLEEQTAAGAATDTADSRQVAQVQNSICDLLEQVSNLKQRQASGESTNSSLQQQVRNLQTMLEKRSGDESSSSRAVSEVEAKVGAVSMKVIDLETRLLEVEGGLEFARENETLPGMEVSAVSVASEVASNAPNRGLPPLPRGDERGGHVSEQRATTLQEQLEAVASQLELLEGWVRGGGSAAGGGGDEVSFGPNPAATALGPNEHSEEFKDLTKRLEELEKKRQQDGSPPHKTDDLKKIVAEQLEGLDKKPAWHTEELKAVTMRMEKLEGVCNQVSEVRSDLAKLQEVAGKGGDTSALNTQILEVKSDLAKLQEVAGKGGDTTAINSQILDLANKVDACGTNGKELKAVTDRITELEKAREEVAVVRADVTTLFTKLGEVGDPLKARITSLESTVDSCETNWKELAQDLKGCTINAKDVQANTAAIKGQEEKLKAIENRLTDRGSEPGTSASQATADAGSRTEEQVKEQVQKQVAELTAEVTAELKILSTHQKELADAKASVKSVSDRIDKVEADNSLRNEVNDLVAKVRGTETSLGELRDIPKKVQDLASSSKASLEAVTEKVSKIEGLPNDVTDLAAKVRRIEGVPTDVTDMAAKVATLGDDVAVVKTLFESTKSKLDDLPQKPAQDGESLTQMNGLASRLKAMEERLDSRPPSSPAISPSNAPPTLSAADERARAQVQTMVEDLRSQVLEELSGLAEQQTELVNAKNSIQALAKQAGSGGTKDSDTGALSKIDSVVDDVSNVKKRLAAAEKESEDLRQMYGKGWGAETSELRKQIEELRARVKEHTPQGSGSIHKIGIGIGSTITEEVGSTNIAFLTSKLETLSETVAELQRREPAGSSGAAGDKGDKAREALKDSSLNFSLTEDQTVDRIGGNSLNYSLTEQSRRGAAGSKGGSPIGSPLNSSAGSDADNDDALGKMLAGPSGKAASSTASKPVESNQDTRPRPPALNFDEDASATGGHLPSVAEEESADLGDEDAQVKGGLSASGSSAGAVARSKAGMSVTPKSTRSSVESPSGGLLEISQSANEFSMGGCDISVEDSLQLEDECDHVETVKPNPKVVVKSTTSPDAAAGGRAAGNATDSLDAMAKLRQNKTAVDALDSLMGPVKSPASATPGSASRSPADSSGKSPLGSSLKSPAGAVSTSPAASTAVGLSTAAAATTAAGRNTSPLRDRSPKEDGEDKYGDESFDDDMSVPESIEESVASGSDED